MTGKVQCVYIDPPYGIKYGSNFSPFVNKRDVKDGNDEDLTAEPEMTQSVSGYLGTGDTFLSVLYARPAVAGEGIVDGSGSVFCADFG